MNHRLWLAIALTALGAVSARAVDAVAVPFRALTFDAALKAAQAEHKIVFIDFYTTWCGPCKMLDRQTWTDAAVAKLLDDKAVCLKLDAELEGRKVARQYRVDAYPMLLLLKPDGTELDRIVGFREPPVFTSNFNDALAGKTSLGRARDAARSAGTMATHDQIRARERLADELTRQHKYDEALTEYLWLYDTGMKQEASFTGVRTSFLTSSMGRLAKQYPPAAAALQQRCDEAKARLLGDAGDREAGQEYAALSEALGDTKGLMAVFDQLPATDPRRRAFGLRVYRELIAGRRYNEAVMVQPFDRLLSLFDAITQRNGPDSGRPELRAYALRTAAVDVEALAGAGDLEHATALRDRILAMDSSDAIKGTLREHLTRAGHPELSGP